MAKVLVIGSGGREHALAFRFNQSPQVDAVFVAPGSPCMDDVATIINIDSLDFEGLKQFAITNAIDLVVVGPEIPLVAGISDFFSDTNIKVFGPSQYCAQLEGSKAFAKEMMQEANIPTAAYKTFTKLEEALAYVETHQYPLVLKASGLAAGKGVVIVEDVDSAKAELTAMMQDHKFSTAGNTVVIEEFLEGEEFSYLCLVHDDVIVPLQVSQDHKRAYDHDEGPNTGGMGAYTPVPSIQEQDLNDAYTLVVEPITKLMADKGHPYTGVLYAGLMKTKAGIQVIEFNARFGDPETEVLMVALQSDLYASIIDIMNGNTPTLKWTTDTVIGAVLASKGYPDEYEKHIPIQGLKKVHTPLFHMGTTRHNDEILTNGGRVLFVTAQAPTLKEAQKKLYQEIEKIHCDNLFYRSDIGYRNI